ncbi:MAG TPA: DUF3124 domain-containing protein [Bacteroidota bacterium]|nr:DUF3124 domain-containing protein [Bacteroidota bacterium]
MRLHRILFISLLLVFGAVSVATAFGTEPDALTKGQTVYVSVYSNIFTAPRGIPFSLEATLIIRNTDMTNSLKVTTADFYDTEGKIIKQFAGTAITLKPLETKHIYLPKEGVEGGLGANFIVRWTAERAINAPIVECLMIGARSAQGISFVSPGKVIQEHTP